MSGRAAYLLLLVMVGLGLILFGVVAQIGGLGPHKPKPDDGHTGSTAAVAQLCRENAPQYSDLDPEDSDYIPPDSNQTKAAFAACQEAAKAAPNDPEIQYLLGIAAHNADQQEIMIASIAKAVKLDYCKAYFVAGELYWKTEKDADQAEDYYTHGLACGDERAKRAVFSSDTFASSAYPKYVEALYRGDIETLNRIRFVSASYVAGFYEALKEQYQGPKFNPCWSAKFYSAGEISYKLDAAEKGDAANVGGVPLTNILVGQGYEWAMQKLFPLLFPEQGSKGIEEIRETGRNAGHADEIKMTNSSNCSALLPYNIVRGIKAFANSPRPLWEVAAKAVPELHSPQDLLDWGGHH